MDFCIVARGGLSERNSDSFENEYDGEMGTILIAPPILRPARLLMQSSWFAQARVAAAHGNYDLPFCWHFNPQIARIFADVKEVICVHRRNLRMILF